MPGSPERQPFRSSAGSRADSWGGIGIPAAEPDSARRWTDRWQEARPMAILTLAEGLARGLSFGFYLLAAHALTPSSFGVVQYTIALATVTLAPVQLVGIALRRELGADRGDQDATLATLGSGLAISIGGLGLALALTGIAAAIGLTGTADVTGLLAVIAGLAAFEIYYAIA